MARAPDPEETVSQLRPTHAGERVASLDVIRGFAVLGILLMNIQSFSMIGAAYFNPAASGHFEGIDRWIWGVVHVVADQKFMTLFSLLFGAGIVLVTERAAQAGRNPAGLHYRRTLWLLAIGAFHAYCLWIGDVLVWYGLCSLWVVWFRKLRPSRLLILGLLAVAVGSALSIGIGAFLPQMPDEEVASFNSDWAPSAEQVEEEVALYQGSWSDQMSHRVPTAVAMHTIVYLFFAMWRAGGLMMIGMALFRWRIFQDPSPRLLRSLTWIGLLGGIPLICLGLQRNFAAGWTLEYSRFFGLQYNYWGSLFLSAAYLGGALLLCQKGILKGLQMRLAAVGRMALTNYLMQTVLCTTLFYGHGLGWFQSMTRTASLLVVMAIWAFQLLYSPLWLRRFEFGPAEWLWRSLTYWQLQPFRRQRTGEQPA
jgi:uncharacterized protein